MLKPAGIVMVTLLAAAATAGACACAESDANRIEVAPTRTVKERLGGKASDEQRVDNCKVPLELRGPKPRPDECGDGAGAGAKR
jgi:hypothetical protein